MLPFHSEPSTESQKQEENKSYLNKKNNNSYIVIRVPGPEVQSDSNLPYILGRIIK